MKNLNIKTQKITVQAVEYFFMGRIFEFETDPDAQITSNLILKHLLSQIYCIRFFKADKNLMNEIVFYTKGEQGYLHNYVSFSYDQKNDSSELVSKVEKLIKKHELGFAEMSKKDSIKELLVELQDLYETRKEKESKKKQQA